MQFPFKFIPMAFIRFVAAVLIFTSCSSDDDTPDEDVPLATISFGAAYAIDFTASGPPPLNKQLPYIAGDSLLIGVAYSGCSGDHEFELRFRLLTARRAELWLFKLSPDEACQAAFAPKFTYAIPPSVLSRDRIDVVGPNAVSYAVR